MPDNQSLHAAGIDVNHLSLWLQDALPEITLPLKFTQLEGGRSNITHLVEDATGRRLVHRRPPLSSVLASAHDVIREYRTLLALRSTSVPVPEPIGAGRDPQGVDFYIMDYVEGLVLRDPKDPLQLSTGQRANTSASMIDVLAQLHNLDPGEISLESHGKRGDYIPRQLYRWRRQWDRQHVQDLSDIHALHARLSDSIPPQQGSSVVHGDYKLDNVILASDGDIAAVLDWELSTLGDPLADLALLLVYWEGPGAVRSPSEIPLSSADGFASSEELVARYQAMSTRDLSLLPYYCAFACWKLAIVLEGVFARHAAGAYGQFDERLSHYPQRVCLLTEAAFSWLDAV